MTKFTRYRISLALEALIWVGVIAWLLFLVWEISQIWKAERSIPLRNVFEMILLGLLVHWPFFRTRIIHGYWMRDHRDTPDRHFKTVAPESNQPQRRLDHWQ